MVGVLEMTNYLENIDLLKQLKPIMERLGVRYDDIIRVADPNLIYKDLKTYRSDTLENVLPEWCWNCEIEDFCFTFKFPHIADLFLPGVIQEFREEVHGKRGQPKLEALAKLVILLDGEGLLERRNERI